MKRKITNTVEISMDNGDKIYAPVTYDEDTDVTTSDIVSMFIGKNVQPGNMFIVTDVDDIFHIIFVSKISSIKTFKGIIAK